MEGSSNDFRFEGLFWTISYRGKTIHLLDSKGAGYLARLLREPGRAFHVLELAGGESGATPASGTVERARKAVSNRIRATVGAIAADHPDLGRHLAGAIHTGAYCRYLPAESVRWEG